jgi:hypothetical protein
MERFGIREALRDRNLAMRSLRLPKGCQDDGASDSPDARPVLGTI